MSWLIFGLSLGLFVNGMYSWRDVANGKQIATICRERIVAHHLDCGACCRQYVRVSAMNLVELVEHE